MAFLTDAGLQKLAVATPLQPINVKFMAVGSGTGTPTQNMSALFNEQYRTEIGSPTRNESDPKVLEFEGYIPTNVGGFTITEIGLFDDAGVLIAYDLLSEGIVKAAPTSALKTDIYPTVLVALSNTAQTELIVSQSTQFDHQRMSNRNAADCHPIAAITGLQDELNKAVKLTGNQEISGEKEFLSELIASYLKSKNNQAFLQFSEDSFEGGTVQIGTKRADGSNFIGILMNAWAGEINFGTALLFGDSSNLSAATTTKKGVVQLNNTLTSSATDEAATAAAVKSLNDTKKAVAVLSGTIADGGTIPLPSGYTEAQCKWMVSPSDTTLCTLGANNQSLDNFQLKCFTNGRVVTSKIWFYNDSTAESTNTINKSFTANYIIIGVK